MSWPSLRKALDDVMAGLEGAETAGEAWRVLAEAAARHGVPVPLLARRAVARMLLWRGARSMYVATLGFIRVFVEEEFPGEYLELVDVVEAMLAGKRR